MAGTFPTMRSGNTIFYPLEDTSLFNTGVAQFMDDTEQRYRNNQMLKKFKLTFTRINAYDYAKLVQFFRYQFGKYDATWSITIDLITYNNMGFNSDTMQKVEPDLGGRYSVSFDLVQVISDGLSVGTPPMYFPQINNMGIITQLPYTANNNFWSETLDMDSGLRFSWKWRNLPLGLFNINLPSITDNEVNLVRNFVNSVEGRLQQFTLLDPDGNLVNFSDVFTDASWRNSGVTIGGAASDPFGGNLATAITVTGFGVAPKMVTTVLPLGEALGVVLCASVWAKNGSGTTSMVIGFMDATNTVLTSQVTVLNGSAWTRIVCAITIPTNTSQVQMFIQPGSYGPGTTFSLFSAQTVPTPGPGARLLTPGADGLRVNCRLEADEFLVINNSYNNNSITLPVREIG